LDFEVMDEKDLSTSMQPFVFVGCLTLEEETDAFAGFF